MQFQLQQINLKQIFVTQNITNNNWVPKKINAITKKISQKTCEKNWVYTYKKFNKNDDVKLTQQNEAFFAVEIKCQFTIGKVV